MDPKLNPYYQLKKHLSHESSALSGNSYDSGTVYTPESTATQLIYIALCKYIENNAPRLQSTFTKVFKLYESPDPLLIHKEILSKKLKELYRRLSDLQIIDLSCGSGMLIFAYVEFLIYLSHLIKVQPERFLHKAFKNITAVDISSIAVENYNKLVSKLGECYDIDDLAPTVFHGNALIDEMDSHYDLIIGNPPYIGEKGNREIFSEVRKTPFGQKYYEGKMDYFYFFIYKGYELLKPHGVLCYLTSNYFFTADGAKKLRHFLKSNFHMSSLLDFGNQQVFNTRGLHAAIYTLQKNLPNEVEVLDMNSEIIATLPYSEIYDEQNNLIFLKDRVLFNIFQKMQTHKEHTLGSHFSVYQGIVTGADRKDGRGIFVYHNSEVESLPPSIQKQLKPFYKNSCIRHYHHLNETSYKLLYVTKDTVNDDIIPLLEPFKEHLEKRREVKSGARMWFEITWPRKQTIFSGPKIISPQRSVSNYFSYDASEFYASADVYFIKENIESNYSLKILSLILNSKLYRQWLISKGKKKGAMLELYATPLKNMPLPKLSNHTLCQLQTFSEIVYGKIPPRENQLTHLKEDVDQLLMQSFKLSREEINYINSLD